MSLYAKIVCFSGLRNENAVHSLESLDRSIMAQLILNLTYNSDGLTNELIDNYDMEIQLQEKRVCRYCCFAFAKRT